jgi:hypothetical protein
LSETRLFSKIEVLDCGIASEEEIYATEAGIFGIPKMLQHCECPHCRFDGWSVAFA